MATATPIFGLRFDSNDSLLPDPQELRRFLDGPGQTAGRGLQAYRDAIDELSRFEASLGPAQQPPGLRERMYYGVLGHSSFFSPFFLTAAEQYLFHVHSLATLDFRKPSAFIAAAEYEMEKLRPGRKQEAARRERLRILADERKHELAELAKRRGGLAQELQGIARYVRYNLERIARRCETAIVVLVQFQLAGGEERRVIEDIGVLVREEFTDAFAGRGATRKDVEAAKRSVETLSREAGALLRDDVYALTKLYEAVYDRVRAAIRSIDGPLAAIGSGMAPAEEPYHRIGNAILSLMASCRFPLRTEPTRTSTGYGPLLMKKRGEMLDTVFRILRRERRSRHDRRAGEERRRAYEEFRWAAERRLGTERRTRTRRRLEVRL